MPGTMIQVPNVQGQSPWGQIDGATRLLEGVVLVHTPSHGGIWLSPERDELIPEAWKAYARRWVQGASGWYEEDIAALAVLITFYEELRDNGDPLMVALTEDAVKGYRAHLDHYVRRERFA